MINRSELKEKAKKSLAGHYGDAIVVILLSAIVTSCFNAIGQLGYSEESTIFFQLISTPLQLIVSGLLFFGMLSFFYKISKNEEVDFRELFSKFQMFIPYLIISILTSVFVVLWSFLFIIPGIIAGFAYSQVYLIALENPEKDALEVIKLSKEMMRGYKLEYFILQLSFLGWAILGAFTCGILYLWITPYMLVTNCNFYHFIKEQYEKKNGINQENTIEEKKEVKEEVKEIKPKTVSNSSSSQKRSPAKKTGTSTKKTTTTAKKATTTKPKSTTTKKTTKTTK